jgi:DNA-binding CsgD family transcriptional regulator
MSVHALVLKMVSDAMAQMQSSAAADEVICRHLARAWMLTAASVMHVRPDGSASAVALWPGPSAKELEDHLAARAEQLASRNPQPSEFDYWQATSGPALHVMYVVVRPAAQGIEPKHGKARVGAFAREHPFGPAELELWALAARPLSSMWGQSDLLSHYFMPNKVSVAGRADRARISERELEVLNLLADGLMATSIASELRVSPRTVHRHLANIYSKLGVHDRLLAVQLAQRQGLLARPEAESA